MDRQEAMALKTFKNYCTCGGFAHTTNGRDPRRPHMDWCPQRDEYNEWYDAMLSERQDVPVVREGEG